MYKIIGKLNRKREKSHDYRRILNTSQKIFDINIKYHNLIEFNPDTLLEDDTWFYIDDFTSLSYCLDILRRPISTANYNDLTSKEIKDLHFMLIEDNDYIFIQKVTPSLIMKNKFIYLSEKHQIVDKPKMILFKSYPDAIFDRNQNKLFFKKIETLNSIFIGIEELFREATDEEVEVFLENGFIEFSEGYATNNIKSNNRKRILLINKILEGLEETEVNLLLDYTSEYCSNIPYNTKKFTISNETELKNLMYGLQERYYTTEIGGEERVANSIIVLDK